MKMTMNEIAVQLQYGERHISNFNDYLCFRMQPITLLCPFTGFPHALQ